jgi:hypothetical protein
MPAAKLELRVEAEVLAAAAAYAAAHGKSVSRRMEALLAAVTSPAAPLEATPVLTGLRGSLRGVEVGDWDAHVAEKYERPAPSMAC